MTPDHNWTDWFPITSGPFAPGHESRFCDDEGCHAAELRYGDQVLGTEPTPADDVMISKKATIEALQKASSDESLFEGSWWYRIDGREAVGLVCKFLESLPPAAPVVTEAQHEREMLEVIDERDNAMEWADKLAHAIGHGDEGEHSSLNNPWAKALELAETFSVTQLTKESIIELLENKRTHHLNAAKNHDDSPSTCMMCRTHYARADELKDAIEAIGALGLAQGEET